MKIADAKTYVVGNPPPHRGGPYFVFVKLISDDGIIDPRDTRTVLGFCLSVVRNKAIEGSKSYGVFRL